MMKKPTMLAIVAIIAVASMPLLLMATSAHATNTKSSPRGHANGFLSNPNHFYDKEPQEADDHN